MVVPQSKSSHILRTKGLNHWLEQESGGEERCEVITRQGVLVDEDEASADRVFVCCQLEKYRDKNMLFTEEQ